MSLNDYNHVLSPVNTNHLSIKTTIEWPIGGHYRKVTRIVQPIYKQR